MARKETGCCETDLALINELTCSIRLFDNPMVESAVNRMHMLLILQIKSIFVDVDEFSFCKCQLVRLNYIDLISKLNFLGNYLAAERISSLLLTRDISH